MNRIILSIPVNFQQRIGMTQKLKIEIREAVRSDIDALVQLLKILFSMEEDFSFDETLQRRGLEMFLTHQKDRCIMVAESEGNVIGMCSVQLLVSTAEGGLSGWVEDMVVSPSYHGKGVGQKLLVSIEKWAAERGATRLQLLADRNNQPALRFYDKMNWAGTQLICLHKKPL